ncbi:exonuclease RdgC [Oceanococcus atlanticus]|uniref:Recombination-associated protein RdgC n=1 Tax=Oceanococcus atlanticus TaxID=1317117 RepID=A0A1Y1SHH2_9GAMM|nr:recombination-associated protein RdgC [Oceanococcus atlanticus]ORE89097.1 exonuclease RdgC [Oceanococcus atlanticus]RZO85219.1 MAG: recombination-associated protein RdgC [Oceanococcus sp.]
MWFKNLCLFRLEKPWSITPAALEEQLARKPLLPCTGQAALSRGWVAPKDDDGALVEALLPHLMIAHGSEEKLLPASVINEEAKDKAREFEAQRGYKPGRKQMRDIKDEITMTLLPRAFVRRKRVRAWIDCEQGWLIVDTSTAAAAENLIEHLRATVEDLPPVKLVEPNMALAVTMTEWLAKNAAPGAFLIEDECELNGSEETKSTVRYLRHPLNTEEIRKHITSGKRVSKLGMSWGDKLSFVLNDTLQIKKLKFLDMDRDDGAEGSDVDEEQRFEIDFTLMSNELRMMLGELCAIIGAE